MKSYLHKIAHNLAFRIITPIATFTLAAGFFMYSFVLTTISDFVKRQINENMIELSRYAYNICDSNLNELLKAGLIGNEKAVKIKKALTIGMLEDFMTTNNLKGSVIENDRAVLNIGDISEEFLEKEHKRQHDLLTETEFGEAFINVEYGGRKHYVNHTHFQPWEWHIVLIKDAAQYSELQDNVRFAYLVTGIIFSISVVLLLCYLNMTIKYPVARIITPIKKGEMPEYKGIHEFEFISDSIRDMMFEKERLMKQIIEEQKLKGIRVLASGVAHNFNNILVGVLGYASLIRAWLEEAKNNKQPIEGDLLDEILRHLRTVESSAQTAGALAKELAELSRKRVLEKDFIRQVDINTAVTELERLLKNTFPKNIEISANLSANLPLIKGNASQLEQALLNICINSKDVMPDGGILMIDTYFTSLTSKNPKYPYIKPGSYVTIEITDTGEGMDEETLNHIFEPFFTTKEPDKGTGLGLATVYAIVKAHRGYVIAESTPNKGSTFTIYLPIE